MTRLAGAGGHGPRRRLRTPVLTLVLLSGLALSGCGQGSIPSDADAVASLRPVAGTSLHQVTLTPQSLSALGLRTGRVRSAQPAASIITTAGGGPTASPTPAASATPRSVTGSATPTTSATPASASRPLLIIPLSALIYDPQGRAWTYVQVGPLTFVRRAVIVDHVDGDTVFLRAGPRAGVRIVTIGAPELLGAEYGVGEE